MNIEVLKHFDEADADSLKIELFRDRDRVVRGWYIGPLVRMAKEFVLPFTPREQNLRAETAIARVVEIALAADLAVTLIDPDDLWDELWFSHRRSDPFSELLEPPTEYRRRRPHDRLVARDGRPSASQRRRDRDIHS